MNFYHLPSKQCVVTWSQKCACTALSRWIKHSFHEGAYCPKETSMRTYLAKTGHNFKDINKLKSLTGNQQPEADKLIISYRNPASRITSSFINKFHVYENRAIFDRNKKVPGFAKEFAIKITQNLNRNHEIIRQDGDFSLREMILFLWECKRNGNLSEINPHFTPQLLSKKELDVITSCSNRTIHLFPLKVELLRDDLRVINNALDIHYIPPRMNSTSTPDQDWSFSDSAELIDFPLSKLYQLKIIPKSGSLHKALTQDQDFKTKYMEVFEHDYQLLSWMDGYRQTAKNQNRYFNRPSKQDVEA